MANKLTLNEDLFETPIKEGWENIDGLKFTRTGVHGEKLDDDWIDYKGYLINKDRLTYGDMLLDFKEENGYTRADEDREEFWNEFDEFIAERGLEYLDRTVNESLKEGLSKSKKKELFDNFREASTQLDGAWIDFDAYGGEEDKELINELGGISRQLNAFIKKFGNVKIDESIKEDLFLAPEEPSDETPATPEANGVAKLILDAINDESDTIKMYNDLIANTDNEDIIKIIQDITAEENNHLGMLQRALEIISPNASNIEDGIEEAEGMIEETVTNAKPDFVPVSESLNESLTEDIHDKFKREIKNAYKQWAAQVEKVEKQRKEATYMIPDDADEEMVQKFINDYIPKIFPLPKDFKYDFPHNIEKDDYPFYVTYYAEYPIYEPAEGGYYYAGADAIWSEGFNSKEEALNRVEEYVSEDDEHWKKYIDGYLLSGRYIGEDQQIVVEPRNAYLSGIKGYEPYQ